MEAKKIVKKFLTYLITSESIDEKKLGSYLHPDYKQTVDGKILNKDDCIKHAVTVKGAVKNGQVYFEQLIAERNKVCSVHIAKGETLDGNSIKFKVIAFFELKEDQLYLFDELTFMLEGNKKDEDITRRH